MNNKVNGMFYKANEREFIPMQCEAVYIAPLSKKLTPQIRGGNFFGACSLGRAVCLLFCSGGFEQLDDFLISRFLSQF